MLHQICSDQRSGSTKASYAPETSIRSMKWLLSNRHTFTMDGYGALGLFSDRQEFQRNGIIRYTAIRKKQFEMLEAHIEKPFRIINFLIQTNNGADVALAKVGKICFRCVQRVALGNGSRRMENGQESMSTYILNFTLGMRARKSQ